MDINQKDNFTDVSEILANGRESQENNGDSELEDGQVRNSEGNIVTLGNPDHSTK